MLGDRVFDHLEVLKRVAFSQIRRLLDGQRRRDIAAQRIMRGGLVGDDVRREATADELRIDLGGIAANADRDRRLSLPSLLGELNRFIEAPGRLVEIARLEAAVDAVLIDLDDQRDAVVHAHREWLGAAHAAKPAG